jgi:ankyrin repeat protein
VSNPHVTNLPASPDLGQQRKRAKDLLKAVHAGDTAAIQRLRYSHPRLANAADADIRAARLHDAQWVIAREYGFASWLKLKAHIDEITGVQRMPYRAFETNLQYYRDRAGGLLSVSSTGGRNALRLFREFHPAFGQASDDEIAAAGLNQEAAELVLAREHGFRTWDDLVAHVETLKTDPGVEPFRVAIDAIEGGDPARLSGLIAKHPSLVHARGTNGNRLLHFSVNHTDTALTDVLLAAGADPDAANDKGATPLIQAAYRGHVTIIEQLLAEGASVGAEAYGDGGTPLAFALFWGHAEAAERLAEVMIVPHNLRIAAGLGCIDLMAVFFDTDGKLKPEAGHHREFHRPHSGFPPWRPSDDPQQILDEALTYAARSNRVEAMDYLHARSADLDAEPYNGTALACAVLNGRMDAITWLLDHGADINKRCGYGGAKRATPLHFAAAWGGQPRAAELLVARGADLDAMEDSYQATPADWAGHFGHKDIEAFLLDAAEARGP